MLTLLQCVWPRLYDYASDCIGGEEPRTFWGIVSAIL